MKRRQILQTMSMLALGALIQPKSDKKQRIGNDREYWFETMIKIASPVIKSLSIGKLTETMIVESKDDKKADRAKTAYLEAFSRTYAGIAPWLELNNLTGNESKIRNDYKIMIINCLENAINPKSPDYMDFSAGRQPLVEIGFLALALIRSKSSILENLSSATKSELIRIMIESKKIKPSNNNWILFTLIIESFLLKMGEYADRNQITKLQNKITAWYRGDGVYSDGNKFAFDYYNSYVIHPFLLEISKICLENDLMKQQQHTLILKRAKRYAEILERLIAPDGSYPAVGRSLAYRFGAFHHLASLALNNELPESIAPGQVRSAMQAVITKSLEPSSTFDSKGFLRIGFYGYQPDIGEFYINTGSLYLCCNAFLPLGLSPNEKFWTDPQSDWTSKQIWTGKNINADSPEN